MKKLFNKLFHCTPTTADITNITSIVKEIGPMLDKSIDELFAQYYPILIQQEPTFIIYAVWGARKDGVLTDTQREIHEKVTPLIEDVCCHLDVSNLNPSQGYAIGYLIRSIIISRITYSIELFRNKMRDARSEPVQADPPVREDIDLSRLFSEYTSRKRWRRPEDDNNTSW